jgi:outer membrane protein
VRIGETRADDSRWWATGYAALLAGVVAVGIAGPPARAQSAAAPGSPAIEVPAGPMTLDEATRIALGNNPDLRAAAERIAVAEARVGEATSAFFPNLSARLAYNRTDNPAQAFAMIVAQRRFSFNLDINDPGATQDWRPEVMAAMPLFRGGRDYQRRAAAALGVQAATFERAALRNALTDAVAAAYYALLAAPEQVDVAQRSIEAVDSALKQTRARFEAGAALKSDILSLEVRETAAREGQVRARNGVELARTGLRVLLGLDSDVPVDVLPVAGEPTAPAATFDEALQRGLAHRPELQAANRLVDIREHEVKAERAAYWPRVDAVGTYGQNAQNLELSQGVDNWAFGAVAEIDLFNGFRTSERVRAAERNLAEARDGERKAHLDVERDVRTAFLNYEEARERAQVTAAAVAASEEALRLVQAQYEAGAATITRYLETEAARTDARSRAIAARYDVRRAASGLTKAMGAWAGESAE